MRPDEIKAHTHRHLQSPRVFSLGKRVASKVATRKGLETLKLRIFTSSSRATHKHNRSNSTERPKNWQKGRAKIGRSSGTVVTLEFQIGAIGRLYLPCHHTQHFQVTTVTLSSWSANTAFTETQELQFLLTNLQEIK